MSAETQLGRSHTLGASAVTVQQPFFEYGQPGLVREALGTRLDLPVTVDTSSSVVGIECGTRKHCTDVIDDWAGDERQWLYEIRDPPHTIHWRQQVAWDSW